MQAPKLNIYTIDFQQAVAFVLVKEGGYAYHVDDPGGETNFGISGACPREDIFNLAKQFNDSLYRLKQ